MMTNEKNTTLLVILDGWGESEEKEYNAIYSANTPTWDYLRSSYVNTCIDASGGAVGLPDGQMGNSEVGHLNLGAGRVVYQEYTRVVNAIKSGEFFLNETLLHAVDVAVKNDKKVHILGLLSPGGVHSHENQLHAMCQLALQKGAKNCYVHAFLDGRDTLPRSAADVINRMEEKFLDYGGGGFASIIGRYYAMDRDLRWDRVQEAYELLTSGKAAFVAETAQQALAMAYERGETDEFVQGTLIVPEGHSPVTIEDGDVVIFMNFRSDRARQITRVFIEDDFTGFQRKKRPELGCFVSLTEYHKDFNVFVAFPNVSLDNVLGDYLAQQGKQQLRIAETEKYAHVTFFFNGGEETPFQGEERILIPSPRVATYDLQPEMSAQRVTDQLIESIQSHQYDVIICNFANPDMLGHTGQYEAVIAAIEKLDDCLRQIYNVMQQCGLEMLITADHGNAEQMLDKQSSQPQTAHTTNKVPLIYVGKRSARMASTGALSDIAPTLLTMMGMEIPVEMTGKCLLEFK